jgi:hypothetical protein
MTILDAPDSNAYSTQARKAEGEEAGEYRFFVSLTFGANGNMASMTPADPTL